MLELIDTNKLSGEGFLKGIDENWERIRRLDQKKKAAGELVGRYIDHPYADGAAVYIIAKAEHSRVQIQVLRCIGDDWVLPAWGESAWIRKSQAEEFLFRRDKLDEFFGGGKMKLHKPSA